MAKQKSFRVSEEVEQKFQELKGVYQARSENHLWELIISDIYELKKSKALIPYEELNKRDMELKKAIFELGKAKGELELMKTEKEKRLEQPKGFWAKLFGL